MMKRGTKNLVLILMLTGAMIVTGTFSYIPAAAEEDTISLQDESIGGTTGSDGGPETEEKGFWEQEEEIGVEYYTHVQGYGDQTAVTNGDISGTIGESKRLEAISISLTGLDETDTESGIQYMTQIQDVGWEDEWSAADGGMSGTSGKSKRLEAIRIRLDGPVAEEYDVYYRVYCQSYGWLNWAKNGEYSGSEGLGKRLEAIQIMLMLKNEEPGNAWAGVFNDYEKSFVSGVLYRTHVQNVGWQSYVENGKMSGTTGKSYRLEGINLKLTSDIDGGIEYQTHVQDQGWESLWASNGGLSGTSGQKKRLEAIRIRLTDAAAEEYDVYYRVHCQSYGWLNWAKNGEYAGSEGLGKRLEGIQVMLVEKAGTVPEGVEGITSSYDSAYVSGALYRTHVQNAGWQGYVSNGQMSGTSGKSYRLEGINIKLTSDIDGGIRYRTHVQDLGWEKNWASNGGLSGTSGKSKRLEAIEIELTGEAAGNYNVYYRVHCQDYGWLGWARDGETAGTEGYSKRLEAIEIKIVPKDQNAPGSTDNITNLLPNTEKSDMISVVEQQEEV